MFAWFAYYGGAEVAEAETEDRRYDEDVRTWRSEQAVKLGLSPAEAWLFANSTADLNVLRALIKNGCPPETAAKIVV